MTTAVENLASEVGDNIRTRRSVLSLTLNQLAEKMGVYAGYISKVETGKEANITLSRLAEFAKALDCLPSDLLFTVNNNRVLEPQEQP